MTPCMATTRFFHHIDFAYAGLSLVDDLAQDIASFLVNAFPTLIGPYLAWRQHFVHSKPD